MLVDMYFLEYGNVLLSNYLQYVFLMTAVYDIFDAILV